MKLIISQKLMLHHSSKNYNGAASRYRKLLIEITTVTKVTSREVENIETL